MSPSRWCWSRCTLYGFQLIGAVWSAAVLAVAIPRDALAQIPSGWGAFLGYTYQRADVIPRVNGAAFPAISVSRPPGAINGWVASVERVFPSSTVSWVGEVRGAYATGRFGFYCLNFGPPCDPPLQHASQYLLLTGLRFGGNVRRIRLFLDGLAGMAKANSSTYAITGSGIDFIVEKPIPIRVKSLAVEGGAGVDVPIRQHIGARVRASWLSTDLYESFNQGWNHSAGLSAGIVLR